MPTCTGCSSVSTRRAELEVWLNRRWYAGNLPPPWWLLPLSWLFGAVAAFRRGLYRVGILRARRIGVPVVVVGNVNVGGSGKTPVVIAVVEALRAAGRRPGVVSRGYGALVPGVRVLREGDSADAVGDEPGLMRERGIPVAIGADRVRAAISLLYTHKVDVIVADDGLQHYRLARACEVIVIDGRRRFGNGALLPAGPLREPVSRLSTVDVVLTSGPPVAGEFGFRLIPDTCVRLADGETRPLNSFRGQRVHAVAGIGDPRRFFDMLARHGIYVTPHPYPDHHRFRGTELIFDDGLPVLLTEKDAVKCRGMEPQDTWVVRVRAHLDPAAVARIIQCIHRED